MNLMDQSSNSLIKLKSLAMSTLDQPVHKRNSRHLFTAKSAPQDYPINYYVYSSFFKKCCVDCVPNSNSYYNPTTGNNYLVNFFKPFQWQADSENRLLQLAERIETIASQTDPSRSEESHHGPKKSSVQALKISFFVLKKLLQALYDHCLCSNVQLNVLEVAQKRQIPIVYVTKAETEGENDRYTNLVKQLVLQLVLYLKNFRLPKVISIGDSSFKQGLFSYLTSWFKIDEISQPGKQDSDPESCKRRIKKHLEELLRNEIDLNIQIKSDFYDENGIFESLLELVENGDVYDIIVVPTSMKIEKLSFLRGLVPSSRSLKSNADSGSRKETSPKLPSALSKFTECLKLFYHAARALALHVSSGSLRVDFSQPFSLKEYAEVVDEKLSRISKNQSKRLPSLTSHLRSHILHDISQVESVMCSNLIAFALLNTFPAGLASNTLAEACERIKRELVLNYQMGFNCSSIASLDFSHLESSLNLLKDYLSMKNASSNRDRSFAKTNKKNFIITLNDDMESLAEMHRFARPIYQAFFIQSVLATSLLSLARKDLYLNIYYQKSAIKVQESELFDKSFELVKILRYVFYGYKRSCESIYSKIDDKILKLKNLGILSDRLSDSCESGFKFKNKLKASNQRPRGGYYLDFEDENSENEEEPNSNASRQADSDLSGSAKHYDLDQSEIRSWMQKPSSNSKSYRMNLQDDSSLETIRLMSRTIKPYIEAFLIEFKFLLDLFQPERLRVPEKELQESFTVLKDSSRASSNLVRIILAKMNGLRYCEYEAIIRRVQEDADPSLSSLNTVQDDRKTRETYYEMTKAGYAELVGTFKSLQSFL